MAEALANAEKRLKLETLSEGADADSNASDWEGEDESLIRSPR
jgi:hypothetical protein